ncbi:putative ATP-dependent helicase [Candidatus Nitrosotalea sp. TS]|uniref:DEAD/DEAH box helicase n=1 Tax=Candidatus Nitrosotalea sp. TS TaxID=2341020 RepID=UPI001407AE6B|nr:DEAD/DEAH box helicase [Candidatus Nitrosotalea sp. TS]NHI04074.1 putative ATP-dependent helicase [Candidatus Nitrosotalea sp. TS]
MQWYTNDLEQDRQKNQNHPPHLPLELENKFRNLGFEHLTEIQKKAVPVISQKIDSLVIAPTGSGKTETAVIPIFDRVAKSKKHGKIKTLYITPLRALNRDVFRRVIGYAENEGLTIQIRHGDTSQSVRKKIALDPPDVLITTPETIIILLTQPGMLQALDELEWIVIDEVHELLGNERGAQLSLSLERLQVNTKFSVTRVGLSATVGNTSEAAKFVVGTKRRCKIIEDRSIRKYDVEVRYIDGTITDVVDSIIDYVSKNYADSPVLLFTNTRGESEYLASVLKERSSLRIDMHHGSLSQQVREETEETLREGKPGIVVCTSSLELGLDIGSVELVIHYGSPRQVSKLVQRIGRSKHSRGMSAKGLIVTNNADDEFEALAILERVREKSIEDQIVHDGALDVLAHHLVGMTMQFGTVPVDFALKMINQAYSFRETTLDELFGVLDILHNGSIVFFDKDEMVFKKRGRSFRYYFENLSTIPDILKFKVHDTVSKKIIGSLDQRFVGDNGDPGNVFVLRGMQWRILNVDDSSLKINVEPVQSAGINVPYWEGENIPVDFATARKVGLYRTKTKLEPLANKIIESLKMDAIPDEKTIVVESQRARNTIVMHACFGTRINATIATLLSAMLSAKSGYLVDSRSDAYRIMISSNGRIGEESVLAVLKDKYELQSIVRASLSGTHNVNWRTWCVAKKFGIVGREAVYDRKSARFLYERYSSTVLAKEALRELFHDKYDLEGTARTLEKIRDGSIASRWYEVDSFSKLAEPILDHTTKYYSSPANLDKGVLDLVKARLVKTKHRLVCMRCGKWEKLVETHEVKGVLACPHCKSRQIAATFYSDYDLPKIVQKKAAGKKITAEENHKFNRAWKVSSLIENFGSTALVVLSGYGVGADTGARILRNMIGEEELYRQIYEAERQYVTTRGFWD